jgi:hypothetical protein
MKPRFSGILTRSCHQLFVEGQVLFDPVRMDMKTICVERLAPGAFEKIDRLMMRGEETHGG